MNMIERVARASFACWRKRMDELGLHLDKKQKYEGMSEIEQEFAVIHAKAIIAAMREPTDEMLNVETDPLSRGDCEIIYQAMIDAALTEEKKT